MDTAQLQAKSAAIRRSILETIVAAGKGHIGGAFSCTDILTALYYGGVLRYRTDDPSWAERDRLILSKGHSGTALYAILADIGYINSGELETTCRDGSRLGGHPDRSIPGIEADTGSLGHGLGIGEGLALAAKMDGADYFTFVILGDGECQEGSVWEAAMFAAQHRLDNLVAIIDRNRQGVTDFTENSTGLDPFAAKWASFGWEVVETDGHSFEALLAVLGTIRNRRLFKPLGIIANTVKGKGISFMEGQIAWHHGFPTGEQLAIARHELGGDDA